MSGERITRVQPKEIQAEEEAKTPVIEMDNLEIEVVRRRLIELGVLAEGTPISEQRKPYLGQ